MVIYIIRRLIAAVVLLFVVSIVTFSIFFLVPRLAGATPETLASRYVGRTADAAQIARDRARSSASTTRSTCSTAGSCAKGSSSARTTTPARRPSTARRRASATRSSPRTRCWPDLLDRLPVTLSLAVGAAMLWLISGVAIGVLSALRRGAASSTGRRWASRWPASRCRSSSPACCRCRSSATSSAGHRARRQLHPVHATTRPLWAYDLMLPWITLAFLFSAAVRPAHPRRHARDDGRGLHPHRPGQGPARARPWSSSTACGPR